MNENAFEEEILRSQKLNDWTSRAEARRKASERRSENLGRIEELLTSLSDQANHNDVFRDTREFASILEDHGVREAIAFAAAQEPHLINVANKLSRERRRILLPLLEAMRLQIISGELDGVIDRCEKLLLTDPKWLELHQCYWQALLELGDQAEKRLNNKNAREYYEKSLEAAKAAIDCAPTDLAQQRLLAISKARLGDIFFELSQFDVSLRNYMDTLDIFRQLTANSPQNTLWQRDFSIANARFGQALMFTNRKDEAVKHFTLANDIAKSLAAVNPKDLIWQRDLAASYLALGKTYRLLHRNEEALREYENAGRTWSRLEADHPMKCGSMNLPFILLSTGFFSIYWERQAMLSITTRRLS